MSERKGTNLNINQTIKAAVEGELDRDLVGTSVSQLANTLFLEWLEKRGVDLRSPKPQPAASRGLTLAGMK